MSQIEWHDLIDDCGNIPFDDDFDGPAYLVTIQPEGLDPYTWIAWWDNGEWWDSTDNVEACMVNVVAWASLPAPYRHREGTDVTD